MRVRALARGRRPGLPDSRQPPSPPSAIPNHRDSSRGRRSPLSQATPVRGVRAAALLAETAVRTKRKVFHVEGDVANRDVDWNEDLVAERTLTDGRMVTLRLPMRASATRSSF